MKKMLAVLALFILCSPLAACNTADGFGRDLEKAGQSIQKI